MQIIGIVGSRSRSGPDVVVALEQALLRVYTDGDRLVSGGCPIGADRIAETLAKKHQLVITIYYAQWNKHGKSAGFVRNVDIANDATVLIAAVVPARTGGTEHTVKCFLKRLALTEQQAIEQGRLILV